MPALSSSVKKWLWRLAGLAVLAFGVRLSGSIEFLHQSELVTFENILDRFCSLYYASGALRSSSAARRRIGHC
jgi:hypothetical protein